MTSRFVYGVCEMVDNYKKLARYDIVTKKVAPCADVTRWCSVLQMGKRIFVSGGGEPELNTLSEFVEEMQGFVNRADMNYGKRGHKTIAVSPTQFAAIGGLYGKVGLAYCEEYSIQHNAWKMLPSLNQARYHQAVALSGDGNYLYAIGGYDSNGVIERLNLKEKKVWDKVALSGGAEVSLDSYSAAFPISADEIMIFVGGDSTDCGVYNVKAGTVKRHTKSLKSDCYFFNSVCMIDGDAYAIGSKNAHLHIYRTASKKIEEIDYKDASA